ncbi:MAG TPA: FAD-dependent oxidoreductase [Candidatus Limnocylindria bacterium]|nr:FAD-dependent oxidoreductase [Candidatus Limnocylindria bacterium]
MRAHEAEIAVVGGGPAGAAVALRLAAAGHETVLFERLPEPRWRAAGVYTSPLTRRRLLDLGLSAERVAALIRPVSAMVVGSADGRASCRLEYPDPAHACGVDRVRLEAALLERARSAGVEVHEGSPVTRLEFGFGKPRVHVSGPAGRSVWRARLVVGADGPTSLVARSAGVSLPTRHFRRAGLTLHHADPAAAPPGAPMEAELVVGQGWYLGIAPVPGGRQNLGLVVGEGHLRRELRRPQGAHGVLAQALAALPGRQRSWSTSPATDELRVALPLAHRVARSAGRDFLLVGDAAGFVDPLSGEGLQRALASAELAAEAISDWSVGDRAALTRYEARLRARFRSKDVLSWLLQAFLVNPPLAGYALANLQRRAGLRRTFSLALADMLPASRVLDPRFLAQVLAP